MNSAVNLSLTRNTACRNLGRAAIRYVRFTSVRDVASNVANAHIAVQRREGSNRPPERNV
jgi:hypothetical protein